MKKLFTLIIAIFLCINIKAQTSLTEAVNFTVTECYGEEEITLFDILDRGQYVLIDFFFMNCTPCQTVAPKVVEAYKALGCNKHDVFFMEISPVDNNDVCQWWAERYGVEYPTIGSAGGGLEVDEIYDIHSYPTFVLIAPDRSIAFQDIDIYPIPDAQTIIDYLAPYGIEEHSCEDAPEIGPSVIELVVEVLSKTSVKTTATPNEETSVYHYGLMEKSYFDEIGEEAAVQMFREDSYPFYEVDIWEWIDLTPETDYYAIATGQNSEGEWGETTIVPFRTEVEGFDELVKTNFSIYPNPASSTINIVSEAKGTVKIYDMTSRCVKEVQIEGVNTTINIEDLNKGVYFISVNESVKKLVVK